MTNEEVEAALKDAINGCLAASGKPTVELNADVIPLEGVEGFDSLCAMEVLVDIEANFGLKAEGDVFLEGDGSKARKRTIREIAALLNQ